MKKYDIHVNDGDDEIKSVVMEASDLPAALHGFYAAYGPASGGGMMPSDFVSISEADEDSRDTMAQWLHERYGRMDTAFNPDWSRMGPEERSYWEHEAAAVRRAVKRGGYNTHEEK